MQKEEGRMQKGEWLPFSLLFSFCILHFHSERLANRRE
jgi:hypothetical protein